MRSRCSLLGLFAALLPGATVAPAWAQLLGPPEYLTTAILERFPDREGRILVRGRDGQTYTLYARGARVEVGNRGPGTWDDLRLGVVVDLYGQRRGSREFTVARLHIVGGETGVAPRQAIREWRDGSRHQVTGRVISVDRARQSLRLRVGEETIPVELFDQTRFSRRGEHGQTPGLPARFQEVHLRDRIRVTGEAQGGRLVAKEVLLLEARDDPNLPSPSARAEGSARASQPTGRSSDQARERDTSKAEGARPGAAGGAAPRFRALTGVVVSLDASRTRLRLRTQVGEYLFAIGSARVTLAGREVERTEIRPGDLVRIEGRSNGAVWVAERVEIIVE